jgi:triosephosphate isomerase
LESQFSKETAQKVILLYGGSVKADNALELLSEPNIDGALVGGASLKQDSFEGIVRAASSVHK